MKLGNIIQCNGCGATNKLPNDKDVTKCLYCGGFIERKVILIEPATHIKEQQERKEMIEAIINDPLVRSVLIPKKSPMYIQLPMSLYKTIGLNGIAAIAFGLLY